MMNQNKNHRWIRAARQRPLVNAYLTAMLIGVEEYSRQMEVSCGVDGDALYTLAKRIHFGKLVVSGVVTEKGLRYMRGEI